MGHTRRITTAKAPSMRVAFAVAMPKALGSPPITSPHVQCNAYIHENLSPENKIVPHYQIAPHCRI